MESDEEPVECTSCGEVPQLYFNPYADEPYRLRCGCDLASAGVTACVEDNRLFEPITGKWSNTDYDSNMKNA